MILVGLLGAWCNEFLTLQVALPGKPCQTSCLQMLVLPNTWRLMTGADVKKLREALGLTLRDMATILGVSHSTIQRGESRGPTRELVLIIERALADGSLKLSGDKAKPE